MTAEYNNKYSHITNFYACNLVFWILNIIFVCLLIFITDLDRVFGQTTNSDTDYDRVCIIFGLELVLTALIIGTSHRLNTAVLWADDKKIMFNLKLQIGIYLLFIALMLTWVLMINGLGIIWFNVWFVFSLIFEGYWIILHFGFVDALKKCKAAGLFAYR